jgi:hypothetical protein
MQDSNLRLAPCKYGLKAIATIVLASSYDYIVCFIGVQTV